MLFTYKENKKATCRVHNNHNFGKSIKNTLAISKSTNFKLSFGKRSVLFTNKREQKN